MKPVLLYIDPGTGSMLFTILIGIISTCVFFIQKLSLKIKFRLSGGKEAAAAEQDSLEYVIFSDSKRYWNTFKPICDEFEARKIPVAYWTASPDDPALNEKYEYVSCEFIGEGNKAFAKLNLMKADICLSTTPGLDVYQWKRSDKVKWYVHIFHAVSEGIGYKMFGLDFYDAVLTTGELPEKRIRQLEKMRGLSEKELHRVGITYMDSMRERLDKAEHEAHDIPTVLLAPSWGKSSILCRYGAKIIDALLQTGYRIVIRPHPQSLTSDKEVIDPLMQKYPDGKQLSWDFSNDNFMILNEADIMISDFSGVMFDFAFVFDKPLIYADTSFDSSIYDAAWIDEPMWLFQVLPSIGIPLSESGLNDIKATIDQAMKSEKMKESRTAARNLGWQNIGKSAEAAADYLIEKHGELAG
ncbi:MAG: CDP-glycerol glycerophosphotransferase family protein [Lachnospiraceae bacterium]|nr:CDP-glycerol glycerophosphotransferase family protein [Lachnospiraceae bacterium]